MEHQNIIIEKAVKMPVFRYTPSRMVMQRIINRYFNLGDKIRNDVGDLITYKDSANNLSLFPFYQSESTIDLDWK